MPSIFINFEGMNNEDRNAYFDQTKYQDSLVEVSTEDLLQRLNEFQARVEKYYADPEMPKIHYRFAGMGGLIGQLQEKIEAISHILRSREVPLPANQPR